MGNAGRHHAPPARALPPPPPPPAVAREATIPPGGTATATWNFHGGRGTEIEIANVGSAPCEFEGHLLRAGKTATVSVRDGTREFALAITSAGGTRVSLTLAAWRAAAPPRRTLGVRRVIERDPRTHTISSITEIPVWVTHEEDR